jgi:sulfur carrier protein
MNVSVNGEPREVAAGTTLEALADALTGGELRGVAVALDGAVVPRARWADVVLTGGQAVEVLRAVQGG